MHAALVLLSCKKKVFGMVSTNTGTFSDFGELPAQGISDIE